MQQLDWKSYNEIKDQLSDLEKDWLFDEGSLTKRLTLLSNNNFSLEVLSERKDYLRDDEYQRLNISFTSKEWIREVILKGYDEPWIYARTIIHDTELQGRNPLVDIGQQPLGLFLFDKNRFKRSSIEVTICSQKNMFSECFNTDLWVRRSSFKTDQYNLLVQEVFLSSLWKILYTSE